MNTKLHSSFYILPSAFPLLSALALCVTMAPASAQTGFGTALSFNGTNNYVDLGASTAPRLGTNFTQEAWIYPQPTDNEYHGFLGDQPDGQGTAWRSPCLYFAPDNALHVGFGTGSDWVSAVTPTNVLVRNAWNHVAATFVCAGATGNFYTVYVNGQQVLSASAYLQ